MYFYFFCYLRTALLKPSLISPKSSSTLLHLDHQHQQGHLFIITYCKQNKQKMFLTYALFQLPPHLSSRHSKTSPKSCLQIWSPLCYLPFSQLTLHFHTSFSYHIYITQEGHRTWLLSLDLELSSYPCSVTHFFV